MYKKRRGTFTTPTGQTITRARQVLEEPPSGEALGTAVAVRVTPDEAGETIRVFQRSTVAGASRVDVRIDSGAYVDGATEQALGPAGVEQAVDLRPVALPYAGDQAAVVRAVVATGKDGAAGWLL